MIRKIVVAAAIMASAALSYATTCPNLSINGGAGIPACKESGGACHYVTAYLPKENISSATAGGLSWSSSSFGTNVDCSDDPCNTGQSSFIHWIFNGNNLVVSHYCPQETPTPTPTPPPPTPTPPTDPTPTPTPKTPTPTPTPYACIPETECRGRCGMVSDGCRGTIDCGICPLPTPYPDCTTCEFPAKYMAETGAFFLERIYFPEGGVIHTFIVEGTQPRIYELVYWLGDYSGTPDRKNTLIHRWNGPGIVTIPVPPAGFPIPPGAYVEIYGGKSRVTVYVQDPDTKVEVQHFNRLWEFTLVRSH